MSIQLLRERLGRRFDVPAPTGYGDRVYPTITKSVRLDISRKCGIRISIIFDYGEVDDHLYVQVTGGEPEISQSFSMQGCDWESGVTDELHTLSQRFQLDHDDQLSVYMMAHAPFRGRAISGHSPQQASHDFT